MSEDAKYAVFWFFLFIVFLIYVSPIILSI